MAIVCHKMKYISLFLIFISGVTGTTPLETGNVTSLRVTLHVFSGRPDPVWCIHRANRNFEGILNGVVGHESTQLGSQLGYRGFSIELFKDHALDRTVDVGRSTRSMFETLLLDSVTDLIPEGDSQPLSDSMIQYVREQIQ